MPSKLESSGPPDGDSRITQVAGPTELAVCEGVVITRIQPTPKSFRVNTGVVGALQARSNAWRTAQLKDNSKSSPAGLPCLGFRARCAADPRSHEHCPQHKF
jgi:hypothetical protein